MEVVTHTLHPRCHADTQLMSPNAPAAVGRQQPSVLSVMALLWLRDQWLLLLPPLGDEYEAALLHLLSLFQMAAVHFHSRLLV